MAQGARVEVEGLRELTRALRKVDSDLPKQMKEIHLAIVQPLVPRAQAKAPHRTGALASSVKASATQRGGGLRAGSPRRVPYAGAIHFGWPKRGIQANPFLKDTIDPEVPAATKAYERGLEDFLRKVMPNN